MTTLTLQELQAASSAADAFIQENGDCGMPYESILSLCFIKQILHQSATIPSPAPASQRVAMDIPDWFKEGLLQCQGRRMTSTQVLSMMGQETNIKALRDAGGWLRQIYGEPLRSGGKTLFVIPWEGDRPLDSHSATAPNVPLGSRALLFAQRKGEGLFTPKEIAHQLGAKGTQQEVNEIGRALHDHGYEYTDGRYNLALVM